MINILNSDHSDAATYSINNIPFKGRIADACPDTQLPSNEEFLSGLKPPIEAEIYYTGTQQEGYTRQFGGSVKDITALSRLLPAIRIRFPNYVIVLRYLLRSAQLRKSLFPLKDRFLDFPPLPFLHLAGTISENGGSIGYHLDNYHIIILQLSGTRTWHLWDRTVITNEEKAYFTRENKTELPGHTIHKFTEPAYTFELKQGEFLFIPALFPHEGITTNEEQSISLSYTWTALSGFKLLKPLLEFYDADLDLRSAINSRNQALYYEIIEELPYPGNYENWLNEKTGTLINDLYPDIQVPLPIQKELAAYWLKAFNS